MKKTLFSFLLICIIHINTFAQMGASGVEMATDLRSSGKIYVVVLGVSVIFLGLIFYLFTIDRKIGRVEKQLKDK